MKISGAFCSVLLKGYRWFLAPIFISLGVRCRFEPSCSLYASEAVQKHGAVRGAFLAAKRLLRCHPLCEGGRDPVPPVWKSQL